MYKEFSIKNFKCFEDLKLTGLKRVNLIAGKNNVGKTALLEALLVHCGMYNPNLLVEISNLRLNPINVYNLNDEESNPWKNYFYQVCTEKIIDLDGLVELDDGDHDIKLSINAHPDNDCLKQLIIEALYNFSSELRNNFLSDVYYPLVFESFDNDKQYKTFIFVDPGLKIRSSRSPKPHFYHIFLCTRLSVTKDFINKFSDLKRSGLINGIIVNLQMLEPRLEDISVLIEGDQSLLYCKLKSIDNMIPLQEIGEGVMKLLRILIFIGTTRNGVLFIDEIENGIHHSALSDVWKIIYKTAQDFNVQIFATTHSYECIQAAHEVFSEADGEKYDFNLTRLENIKGKIKAISFSNEDLKTMIANNFEVR